ncbi:MAG: hypothetical protein IKJ05_05525 [Oscillospiraceae bacterium]|nr:hypothetical protein [Oscillospiraceae bacterium]
MTLILKILSVLGIILGVLLLLVLWVIIMPRHFWVEYCKPDGPVVKMNIGPFRLRLFPLPDFIAKKTAEKKTKPENKKTEKKQEKTEKPNPLADIQFSFDLVKQVVSAAKGIMARIFKAIKFRDISFTVPVHGSDALKTQQTYGIVTNSFYSLSVFLQKHLQITFKSPIFVADFADRYKDSVYFYCQITASPVLLLTAAWFAYEQYKSITENNKKAPDATLKENTNG